MRIDENEEKRNSFTTATIRTKQDTYSACTHSSRGRYIVLLLRVCIYVSIVDNQIMCTKFTKKKMKNNTNCRSVTEGKLHYPCRFCIIYTYYTRLNTRDCDSEHLTFSYKLKLSILCAYRVQQVYDSLRFECKFNYKLSTSG